MNPGILLLILVVVFPLLLVMWNRQRVKGKILCYFIRKDKSVIVKLCELQDQFVLFGSRAYDVYPDLIRIARFPMGWPAMFQELVPSALYDEEDAVPLDWITLGERKENAMNLRSALEENWVRKLVHEAATEGVGFRINWRKVIPIALIAIGIIGLIVLFLSGRVGG